MPKDWSVQMADPERGRPTGPDPDPDPAAAETEAAEGGALSG